MKLRSWVGIGSGLAVVYVLGTHAGRAHYEQLRSHTVRLARDPKVQQTVADLAGQVSKNAHVVPAPFSLLVGAAAGLLQETLRRTAEGTPADKPSR